MLVKADTIGVSIPEVLVRRGTYAWMPPLPAIPGIELSGTVVAHGPNTAEPALGQPVFVSARDLPARAGCYAEYIAVPARAAHPLPPGCSLVHTAAGGVGSAAVQLALQPFRLDLAGPTYGYRALPTMRFDPTAILAGARKWKTIWRIHHRYPCLNPDLEAAPDQRAIGRRSCQDSAGIGSVAHGGPRSSLKGVNAQARPVL